MSVRQGFSLLIAVSALALLAACGGSSSPTAVAPPSGGFSASNFKGTYVLSIAGTDANATTSSFFAIVGTITADGGGNITGGTVDINDPNIGGFFPAQAVSAGKYNVGSDGRGTGALVTPQGTFALDFVLTSNGHGLITRFDSLGSGSGTLDLQTSTSQSALTSLAFSLAGTDSSGGFLLGSVGAATLNSSGVVTAGTLDFNEGNSSAGLANLPLSGSVTLTSGTNGTATLTTSSIFSTLAFNVWVVDSTHVKLIETDTAAVLAGDAFTQQTTFPAGQLAYTLAGTDSSGFALVAGGLATTDVNGNLTNGLEDYNDNGTANTAPTFTGSCTTFVAGRCQLVLTGFSNGGSQSFQFAAYPSSGGILLLEVDSFGLLQGTAYAQTATSFAASQGYGLNLTGTNGAEVDDIGEFTAGASTASPNMTPGLLDENDLGTPNPSENFSGTYTPDSTADGRGSIAVPTLKYGIGTMNLEYYVVDASTVLFIQGDATQVSVGTFQLQTASSSPAGAALTAPSALHAVLRSHANLLHKR
jgi:hypothetical protein